MRSVRRACLMTLVGVGAVWAVPLLAQAPTPPASTSSPAARELVGLLESRKLEAFAVRDDAHAGHYIAALHIPGVQLMVVAAAYKQPSHIEYRLYHKEYMAAYQDLRSGILADNRIVIEDAMGDGLVPIPPKNTGGDTYAAGGTSRTFDGDFADPRRRNQKKISQEEYFKLYGEADSRYATLLQTLLAELKKVK